jgi:hypothetical protein
MDTKVPIPPPEAIEGSRERGYRHAGQRYYTWEPDRASVLAWVRELSPFDRDAAPGAPPPEAR